MTENYEQELKLIDCAIDGDSHESWCQANWHYVVTCNCRDVGWISSDARFKDYFNPAHMRQRIDREMAKDARLAEQEARIKELEDAMQEFVDKVDNGYARSIRTYTRFKELLK